MMTKSESGVTNC